MKLLPSELADLLGCLVYQHGDKFYSGTHDDSDVTEEIETATRLINAELEFKEN